MTKDGELTSALLLLPQCSPKRFNRLFQVVLFLLHVLNCLVPFGKEALKAPDLSKQPAADLEGEFCVPCQSMISKKDDNSRTDIVLAVSGVLRAPGLGSRLRASLGAALGLFA